MNKKSIEIIINNLDIYRMCDFVINEEEAHRFEHRDNLMFAMEKLRIYLKEQFGIIKKEQTSGETK